jgi:hypothetical protein
MRGACVEVRPRDCKIGAGQIRRKRFEYDVGIASYVPRSPETSPAFARRRTNDHTRRGACTVSAAVRIRHVALQTVRDTTCYSPSIWQSRDGAHEY